MAASIPLVLTTGVRGDDGLALLSREVTSVLDMEGPVEVWSLTDREAINSGSRSARGSRLRYGAWGFGKGLVSQDARIVVTLHSHLLPVALPLIFRGARLFHVVVGIDAWKPLSRLQNAALCRAWRITAISQHSATEFLRANPRFSGTDISVCHPGIPDNGNGGGSVGTYALVVGRMSSEEQYKGHDLLLEIWNEVRGRFPAAELRIAGDGDDRSRLEEKAKRLGLDGSVRFLGKIPSEELERLYRECAFYVMPSRREGFGLVFLESMRAGKAAIGALGAASEIIENGTTGYVVDPDDRNAVVAAIVTLWTDPVERERMAANARRRFLERFTRERFAERFRCLLTWD